MALPVDPTMFSPAAIGPEWSVGPVAPVAPAEPAKQSFGAMLGDQIAQLAQTQAQAGEAARGLATGQAESPEAAVMAVERARLSMQLASQIRTKSVEGLQEILHTQV